MPNYNNFKEGNPLVSVIKSKPVYPKTFYPPISYPEISTLKIYMNYDRENYVYDAVRLSFFKLGMDSENYGKKTWNPFREIISSGDTVLIKPNLVKHNSNRRDTTLEELITHPSIISVLLDYVVIALKRKGTVIIGDSPIQETDFNEITNYLKVYDMFGRFKNYTDVHFEISDFRKERSINKKFREIIRYQQDGDPRGYRIVKLGEKSSLIKYTKQTRKFRVTNYDKKKMLEYHSENKHNYLISNSVLNADVVISLPKLKTHRKAGMTCALKNVVGINGAKDCLPHHRKGSIKEGGDEYLYPSFRKKMLSRLEEIRAGTTSRFLSIILYFIKYMIYISEKIIKYQDPYKEGSWYGNDTIPRTICDLNNILKFTSKNGSFTNYTPKRKTFVVTDAIISGEDDGPLNPSRFETGIIVTSRDFIANDIVCCYLMGFEPSKLPTIMHSLDSNLNLNNIKTINKITISSNIKNCNNISELIADYSYNFKPTKGWKDHIEM